MGSIVFKKIVKNHLECFPPAMLDKDRNDRKKNPGNLEADIPIQMRNANAIPVENA